ncbi:MAG: hypothetical protein KGR26_02390 [Cyanobacteria bacterium REEB65]|nr:hypothetical protein [Cyanobacteria bacterium REEB65]
MGLKERALLPGEVLVSNLLHPATKAVFLPSGTVLNASIIEKIKNAGLGDQALRYVVSPKTAQDMGLELKRFAAKSAKAAADQARWRAHRLTNAATNLRKVFYMLLGVCAIFGTITLRLSFVYLAGAVFLGLLACYVVMNGISSRLQREIDDLRAKEIAERREKNEFLRRVAMGEEDAIAEVLTDGVLGKDRLLTLDIQGSSATLHAVLPDSLELARTMGRTIEARPTIADLKVTRSLRSALPPEVDLLLAQTAHVISGTFSFAPTISKLALSFFDPFEDPVTRTAYLGCITTILCDRLTYEMLGIGSDLSLNIRNLSELKLDYEPNKAFHELKPAVHESSHVHHAFQNFQTSM